MQRGLTSTAAQWPAIETAYGWVHQAAHLLANHDGDDADMVRTAYTALLAAMAADRAAWGTLAPALDHFLKVTDSYAPGLFHCYDHPELPRTNNDLEHVFGVARYHERRTNGRKQAAPALVVRGAVRILTTIAARSSAFGAADLIPGDVRGWRALRATLEERQEARRAQRRFRMHPDTYLAALEAMLLKPTLPP